MDTVVVEVSRQFRPPMYLGLPSFGLFWFVYRISDSQQKLGSPWFVRALPTPQPHSHRKVHYFFVSDTCATLFNCCLLLACQSRDWPKMDLTPVRIRGKKRKLGASVLPNLSAHAVPDSQQAKRQRTSKAAKYIKRARSRRDTVPAMPTLQDLPAELLEMVFLHSMNMSLPRASPALGRKLSSPAISMKFVMRAFFHTVDHRATVRLRDLKTTSDPVLQSEVLTCRFFNWPFFLSYVNRAHDGVVKVRGKAWAKTAVTVPNASYFDGL